MPQTNLRCLFMFWHSQIMIICLTMCEITHKKIPVIPVSHYREDSFLQRTRVKGTGSQLSTGLHWHSAERGQQARIRPRGKHSLSSHTQGRLWKYDQMKTNRYCCILLWMSRTGLWSCHQCLTHWPTGTWRHLPLQTTQLSWRWTGQSWLKQWVFCPFIY